ncbi:MAG: lipoyl synthase [Candidatus Sumerlaeia bacterium]|nr:lipoyl synthase [Candidatus Sumerlaeia bacterium]
MPPVPSPRRTLHAEQLPMPAPDPGAVHPLSETPESLAAKGRRLPDWIKGKMPSGDGYHSVRALVNDKRLHTVCEEARCPNLGECWSRGTATFMILGDVCTRACTFCAVKSGRPTELDLDEPRRVAESIAAMGVKHAVITSVNRDELVDGGASIFAETIRMIRAKSPGTRIELLIPDILGRRESLDTIFDGKPEILNHNIETVPRLYSRVRPQAAYGRSLQVLQWAKEAGLVTKSGLMLGLGERLDEVEDTMRDLRAIDCDILTLGQYLRPTPNHHPVVRFVHPEEFANLKRVGMEMGFKHVESGPLVRSSYHAEEQSEFAVVTAGARG